MKQITPKGLFSFYRAEHLNEKSYKPEVKFSLDLSLTPPLFFGNKHICLEFDWNGSAGTCLKGLDLGFGLFQPRGHGVLAFLEFPKEVRKEKKREQEAESHS